MPAAGNLPLMGTTTAGTDTPRVLVITGMHRSGTSLMASLLQHAGVHVGDDLLGNEFPGNPRGHFEDRSFLDLHEDVLSARGLSSFVEPGTSLAPFEEPYQQRARELIAAREEHALWGWKDPRTTLFLDSWHALLPAPRYLLLYRHPLAVLASLIRRGVDAEVLYQPEVGLRVWLAYNQHLLDFHHRHREICFLCAVDAAVADLPAFCGRLAGQLQLTLRCEGVDALFHPDELRQVSIPAPGQACLEALEAEVAATYRQLQASADLPAPPAAASDPAASWEPLGQLCAGVEAGAEGGRRRQALLTLLLCQLWPDLSQRHASNLSELRRRADEHHRAALSAAEDLLKNGQEFIARQKAYIETLEQQKREFWAEGERLRADLAAQSQRITELEAALAKPRGLWAMLRGRA